MSWVNILFIIGGIGLFILGLASLLSESSNRIYIGALVCGPIMAIRGAVRLMNRD